MRANQATHSIATMCRVLDVSASGFYAWKKRGPSRRALDDASLLEDLRAFHRASRGTYGAPRLHRDFRAAGRPIGRKRVARLLQAGGLARRESAQMATDHGAVPGAPAGA